MKVTQAQRERWAEFRADREDEERQARMLQAKEKKVARKTAYGDKVKKWPDTKAARDLAAEAYQALVDLYDKAEAIKARNDKLSARPTVDEGRFSSLKGGK